MWWEAALQGSSHGMIFDLETHLFSKVPILSTLNAIKWHCLAGKAAGARQPRGRELWPAACWQGLMSAIVYRVRRQSGDYIKAAVVAANRSEETRFGVVDGMVVSFLLLCACGLVCLLALI